MSFQKDDSLGKSMMLLSTERMTEFLSLMRKFKSLSWSNIVDIITVGVWDATVKDRLLRHVNRQIARGVRSPGHVPNLDTELRIAVSDSFHVADRLGGISGIGSMVFEPRLAERTWKIYNPALLIANLAEGGFGRISGVPGSGKTNTGCVIIEQSAREGRVAFSNIMPSKVDERYFYCANAVDLFTNISQLDTDEQWIFVLDEAGLMYSRPDQTTRRVKDLDKLMKVIRKLHGSMVLIEQRPEAVPLLIQEFATSIFYCIAPGVVYIDLRGPKLHFRDTVSDFPKTTLPFQTYDIGYFEVNVNVVNLLSAISGAEDPHKAMAEWMKTEYGEPVPPVEGELVAAIAANGDGTDVQMQEPIQATSDELEPFDDPRRCRICGKPLTEFQIIHHSKYCGKTCARERMKRREKELEQFRS